MTWLWKVEARSSITLFRIKIFAWLLLNSWIPILVFLGSSKSQKIIFLTLIWPHPNWDNRINGISNRRYIIWTFFMLAYWPGPIFFFWSLSLKPIFNIVFIFFMLVLFFSLPLHSPRRTNVPYLGPYLGHWADKVNTKFQRFHNFGTLCFQYFHHSLFHIFMFSAVRSVLSIVGIYFLSLFYLQICMYPRLIRLILNRHTTKCHKMPTLF